MYEGPIHAADFAGTEESPILRQLRWTDLVARIAASRETRPPAVVEFDEPVASFTAFQREIAQTGQRGVNLDGLSGGKSSRIETPKPPTVRALATERHDD